MYQVYILYSPVHRKTYVGYTSNLEERIKSHNFLATKGYTIRYRPWTLVCSESFPTKREAIIREKELKSGKGRDFIKLLIAEKYPN